MAPPRRTSSRSRRTSGLREVAWILAISLYLLLSIGLIIVSAITLRFGSSFFGATTPANGAGTGGGTGGSGEESGEAGEAPETANTQEHRLLEQARSNVVSSIGVALVISPCTRTESNFYLQFAKGVLALLLNLASLSASIYLGHRWKTEAGEREFVRRKVLVLIVSIVNGILCAAMIALAVGFGIASHALARWTTDLSSATPGYLISACVMSALTA